MEKVENVTNVKLSTRPGKQEHDNATENPDDGFDEVFKKELRRNNDEIHGKSRLQ